MVDSQPDDSARDLINERGFTATSDRAIADRAHTNLALIKYHFGNKQGLQSAVIDYAVAQIGDVAAPLPLADFITLGIQTLPEQVDNPNFRLLATALAEAKHNPKIAEVVRRNLELFRIQLEEMAFEEGYGRAEAKGLSVVLAALFDGLFLHVLLDPQTDLKAVAKALSRILEPASSPPLSDT